MVRTTIGFLALLAVVTAGRAEDKPKKSPTPEEQYQALLKDYQKAQDAFFKEYQAAKTDADKQKVFEEKHPKAEKFAGKFLELARKNPKEDFAVDALVWVVNNNFSSSKDKDGPLAQALNLLLADHLKSEKLKTALPMLAYANDRTSETFLRRVLEKNPHRDVQGLACLTLAKYLHNRAGWARRLKEHPETAKNYESFMGKEAVKALLASNPDKLAKESEQFFERVVDKYADVKKLPPRKGTLGQAAKSQLFENHHLTIGKVAPDIRGEDQDGKQFKLSDYRGKVVVLDFWGNW